MSTVPEVSTIAQALSIAGLTLAPLCSYYFRIYSQTLDFAQILYVLWLSFASTAAIPSRFLDYSWISFMPNFLDKAVDCNDAKFGYICKHGHLVSPLIAWLAITILMLLIIKLVQCKKPHVRYQKFYNFWKGFNRWYIAPLVYYSSNTLIERLRAESDQMNEQFMSAAIILAFWVLWPIVQLIGYKCTQRPEEDSWKKWIQYFSTWRIISIVLICNFTLKFDTLAKYFIYGSLIIYEIIYLIKYKFTYKCCERFIFILQEAVIICVYSIYTFKDQYLSQYDIDIIALFIVFVLEVLIFLPKLCRYCKNDGEEDGGSAVSPEERGRVKRQNSFNDDVEMGEMSHDKLDGSGSPRRGPRGGRGRR